jgi:hypothetical protein
LKDPLRDQSGLDEAMVSGEFATDGIAVLVGLAVEIVIVRAGGDAVLDLFGGSGSTLIACERRGRTARLLELDPRYADVICRRYQEYTGQQAVLDGDGHTFDEIVRERRKEAA